MMHNKCRRDDQEVNKIKSLAALLYTLLILVGTINDDHRCEMFMFCKNV